MIRTTLDRANVTPTHGVEWVWEYGQGYRQGEHQWVHVQRGGGTAGRGGGSAYSRRGSSRQWG
ncbi:hypothetical protein GCM10027436_53000 [Actinophytocola sediminis]